MTTNKFMWAVIHNRKEVVEHNPYNGSFWRAGYEHEYRREDFEYLGEELPMPDEIINFGQSNCANYQNIESEITD